MPQVSKEMIPDISIPAITVKSDTKYETMLNANSRNVSMIGLILRNLQCLKTKLVTKPKMSPIASETMPSIKNSPMISKGVAAVKLVDCSWITVLNRMIETMSLNTPSPNMQLKSLGC